MPTKAKLYVSIVIAAGAAALVASLASPGGFQDPARFCCYAGLAALASTLKIRLPGLNSSISANFLFVLIGAIELSPTETVLIGCLATVVQTLWRPKTRPRVVQVAFNAAAVVIGAQLAYKTGRLLIDRLDLILAIAVVSIVFFIVNTWLVSGILSLLSGRTIGGIWRQCHLWSFPYYLAGAALSGLICLSRQHAGWQLPLAVLPAMYLIYAYYSMYVNERVRLTAPVTHPSAIQ